MNGHKCEVLISYGVGEFRLGLPFLRSYVSSFSYGEDMAITFGVSKAAVNGTMITAVTPQINYVYELPWTAIIVFVLSVLIISFYCVCKCMGQKAKRENEHDIEYAGPSTARKSTINNDDSD